MNNSHYVDGDNFDVVFDEVQDLLQDYYTSRMSQPQSRRSGEKTAGGPLHQSLSFQTQRFERVSVKNPSQESVLRGWYGAARPDRLRKRSHMISRLLTFVFTLVFLVSIGMLITTHWRLKKEQEAFKKLAEQVSQAASGYVEENSVQSSSLEGIPSEQQAETNAYQILYDQNPDFIGWLKVDNTIIDYPVMYTPDNPEYYLRRAFDGSDSESGTLFIGDGGGIDDDLFIIYGHNMDNNTMFGTLDKYADPSFYQDNPDFQFTTIHETREYEIFAAIQTRVLYTSETGYRYYNQAGELDEDAFNKLVSWLQVNSLYSTGITPEYGEQIVILSTCSYHTDNGRFIIAARRINNSQ